MRTKTRPSRRLGRLLLVLLAAILHSSCSQKEIAMSEDRASPASVAVPVYSASKTIKLDAAGADKVWAKAKALPPPELPAEFGMAPVMPSKASVVRAGAWLLFALDATERAGVLVRHSMHGIDLWHGDAFGVELKGTKKLLVYVNAMGAIVCYGSSRSKIAPVARGGVQAAARVGRNGWRVELAVHLSEVLGAEGEAATVECRILRQRQARGLEAFEEPTSPVRGKPPLKLSVGSGWRTAGKVALAVAPSQRFGPRAALAAARVDRLPATDAQWAKMPAAMLRPENGGPVVDGDFQPTEVRAAVTDERIALWVRCTEAHPKHIQDTGTELWLEDSLEIFLGPDRYNYMQLQVNPAGVLKLARGRSGGRRVRPIEPLASVTFKAEKSDKGYWTARLSVPFKAINRLAGAPSECHPANYPWRVNVSRNRPGKDKLGQAPQLSMLSVMLAGNAHCPARFGDLKLVQPSSKPVKAPVAKRPALPPPVLDARTRARIGAATVVSRWARGRGAEHHKSYEKRFAAVTDAAGWRKLAGAVRGNLAKTMFPAAGGNMPDRGDLNAQVIYEKPGKGFRCMGLILEGQRGLPVPITLYVPDEKKAAQRPALIMIPAHHTGRNSTDLVVLGANFARAGGVAVAAESVGSGERCSSGLWTHKNHQRCLTNAQVLLAGDTLAGWTAFDMSRIVDYLMARGDVDDTRIAIVGGVAGGGEVSALAAALDPRIDVSIPFNFSSIGAMSIWYDPLRDYHGSHAGGFAPWMIDALIAPRKLLQAQEFEFRPGAKASYARFQRVYGLLKAKDNLAELHGGPNTHATHYHAVHRIPMYKILNRWFGMKLPAGRGAEHGPRIKYGRLDCFEKPAGRKYLAALAKAGRLRQPHQLAADIAAKRLAESVSWARMARPTFRTSIAIRLHRVLGDTGPVKDALRVQPRAMGNWRGAKLLGAWLPTEGKADGPGAAVWLLVGSASGGKKRPAVVAVARGGKARFLAERGDQVERLLKAGVAVCLVDVRGCGETDPGGARLPDGPSAYLQYHLWGLNESLTAHQLRDLRTALAWLAARGEVDAERLAVWGEGLVKANGKATQPILFPELGFRQTSPTPLTLAEPTGGLLAMLAAVDTRGPRIRAVLVRGTLVSYMSVLQRQHYYVPIDAIVPGLLTAADTPVIAEALRGTVLLAEDLRDGSNRTLGAAAVKKAWGRAAPADYSPRPTAAAIDRLIEALGAGK